VCGRLGATKGALSTQRIIFFYGKGNKNHQLRTVLFVQHRILSAVKSAEFVGDRMPYIALRVRWCNIIVLNEPAPSEGKCDESKDRIY
jgi:hypothetical protein